MHKEAFLSKIIWEVSQCCCKIIDFREEKLLQRRRFQDAVDDLIAQFDQCSSDDQLKKTSSNISTFVADRLNEVDNIYRKYRIDTTKKILGVSISAPVISNVLSSLLNIPFYMPAGIVSAIAILSADILNERSKAISEIQKDTWAYLWNIKRMNGYQGASLDRGILPRSQ